MELITDARKITIIGLVDDLDTQSWQMDQVEEVVADEIYQSDGVSEFMFGSAVTWFSTLVRIQIHQWLRTLILVHCVKSTRWVS